MSVTDILVFFFFFFFFFFCFTYILNALFSLFFLPAQLNGALADHAQTAAAVVHVAPELAPKLMPVPTAKKLEISKVLKSLSRLLRVSFSFAKLVSFFSIRQPTGVQRNRDAVNAMLAAAGIDPNAVYGTASGASTTTTTTTTTTATATTTASSSSLPISKPTDVQRNRDAVNAMLAAAGIDPAHIPAAHYHTTFFFILVQLPVSQCV